MRGSPHAHLRRSVAVLDYVSRERADAEVSCGGRPLGSWQYLCPSYALDQNVLRLKLHTPTGDLTISVSSARLTSRGAEISVAAVPGSRDRTISLNWNEGDAVAAPIARARMRSELVSWLSYVWPGCCVLSISDRSDLANTLSKSYLRIQVRTGDRDCLILAAADYGTGERDYGSALSQALLWYGLLKTRSRLRGAPQAHLVVPAECSGILMHRAGLVRPRELDVRVWQTELTPDERLRITPADAPVPPIENRDFRWPLLGPFHWNPDLARVVDLAPAQIRRYPRFQEYDSLRLWGLEFARARGEGRDNISFGVGSSMTELNDGNFERLQTLVEAILYYRRPDSPNRQHPYYRLQSERWLESLILEDIPHLFPELVPETVYPQIPVYLGKDPGRVDILGADKEGTLVVLELKIGADPDLPLQALDYWGRVVKHSADGDFRRRGYFSGIRLSGLLPRVYLVSPVFSFHNSTEQIVSHFDPRVTFWKIAINEDWRSGVKILRRTRIKCRD